MWLMKMNSYEKSILEDNSLENHIDYALEKVTTDREKRKAHYAYLLKWMPRIKQMIEYKEIERNAEAVVDMIAEATKGMVNIELDMHILDILSKNGIPSTRHGYTHSGFISGVLFTVILMIGTVIYLLVHACANFDHTVWQGLIFPFMVALGFAIFGYFRDKSKKKKAAY